MAISLCKQDVEFARKLVKALNPWLKVFFYEDRQEELISKSGPEAFAKTFKEEARVVVILSRKEWSETYYTDIERNAIIDRTAVKNEGYSFLMVLPMEQGELPSWYPSNKIYVDPKRFTIEEIASFIEFKIVDQGGLVKSLTIEDRYQFLLNKIEEKKKIIRLQNEKVAIDTAIAETEKIRKLFNEKIALLREPKIYQTVSFPFSDNASKAHFAIGEYMLECTIDMPYGAYHNVVTTQDILVHFQFYQVFGSIYNIKPLSENESRMFYYNHEHNGWALPFMYKQTGDVETAILFHMRKNNTYYGLKEIISTETFIDNSFQQLLKKASVNLERYL